MNVNVNDIISKTSFYLTSINENIEGFYKKIDNRYILETFKNSPLYKKFGGQNIYMEYINFQGEGKWVISRSRHFSPNNIFDMVSSEDHNKPPEYGWETTKFTIMNNINDKNSFVKNKVDLKKKNLLNEIEKNINHDDNYEANLEIRKFDLKSIGRYSKLNILIIGENSNKRTKIIKSIFSIKRSIPIGTTICNLKDTNFFNNFMPSLFIHEEFRTKILYNCIKRQKMVIKHMKQEEEEYGKSIIDPEAFLVVDDCFSHKGMEDPDILKLLKNNKYLKINNIISTRYNKKISKDYLDTFDYIFICKETNGKYLKYIYEDFGSLFPGFEYFREVIDTPIKSDFYILNNKPKNKYLSRNLYWDLIEEKEFKIGDPEIWIRNEQMLLKDEDDDFLPIGTKK
jgi:hypothetical protein